MSGLTRSYDDALALRARAPRGAPANAPTVLVCGRRYPTVPAGDLTAGARVCSPEGQLYTVDVPLDRGVLVVQGPNGALYRWRRKPTTRVPVSWDTYKERNA